MILLMRLLITLTKKEFKNSTTTTTTTTTNNNNKILNTNETMIRTITMKIKFGSNNQNKSSEKNHSPI